jgi:hypothetical protein
MSTAISKLSIARRALIAAKSLNDVLDVCDMAAAIRAFAKAASESLEVQNAASDLRLSAERKAGEMLAKMELAGRGGGDTKSSNSVLLGLTDIGITKMQSSRWQLVSKLPDEEYTAIVVGCNATGRELTQAAVLKAARAFVFGEADEPGDATTQPSPTGNLVDLIAMARSAVADLIEAFGDQHIGTLASVLRDEIETMEANHNARS